MSGPLSNVRPARSAGAAVPRWRSTRVAAVAVAVSMGACGLAGGDAERPTADVGEATRILGGGDAGLEDGVGAREADLAEVFGFGVGPDGTVALAAEASGLEGENGTWLLGPDSTTVGGLAPDGEGADFSFSAGDPLVRSDSVLVPTLHTRHLADQITLDDPVERTPIAPSTGEVPGAEQVFGSLAEGPDGSLWRTYRSPATVRRIADGGEGGDRDVTVDLAAEGCDDAEPIGLVALDDGALVADPGCRGLWAIDAEGGVADWGELPDCPEGVAGVMVPVDVARRGDTVVVADSGCRMVWTAPAAGGPLEPLLGGGRGGGDAEVVSVDDLRFDAPVGVEVDDEGRVYVLDGAARGTSGRALARSPVVWMTGPDLV